MRKLFFTMFTAFIIAIAFTGTASAAAKEVTVKKGDTLYKIAKEHGVSVKDIKKWNNLNSDIIKPNDKLVLEEEKSKEVASTQESVQELTVTASAYTASCKGCSGITATGINLKKNSDKKVIAVDPKVIPLGTEVHVEGYGNAIAADTGGAIKGKRIDVFFPSKRDALNWGKKSVKVTILN
ncbi:3D domain-containing protein [Metabacillus fastidiosus]|uniref:3D domain-containing protein n=1 Tax=Metabacillus fastidiosus TaxID=1458 RepID=A0ABU6NVV2_9BACI|nr:3D domain-containing protein [Metabacillus fastidiosus]MED4401035.1 3D domain-containing protein [Metabacillus fastidiosus]MED4453387.1 3D domain-containing protein [Metabacillus fastidiosus]MED4530819.1 3D domain-containing protein [Metabacillus fastidiosus]